MGNQPPCVNVCDRTEESISSNSKQLIEEEIVAELESEKEKGTATVTKDKEIPHSYIPNDVQILRENTLQKELSLAETLLQQIKEKLEQQEAKSRSDREFMERKLKQEQEMNQIILDRKDCVIRNLEEKFKLYFDKEAE